MERQVSISVPDYEIMADSDCETSSASDSRRRFEEFYRNGMVRQNEDEGNDSEYGEIKKSFLVRMGSVSKEINVVAIHRYLYSSVAGREKLETFRKFSQVVAAKRGGYANVKQGWYGGTRSEICGLVPHGFGRFGDSQIGFSHGIGVYLFPANLPIDSAIRTEEDEDGVRHMVMCEVILGNTQTIAAGSDQLQPSSTDFDSGIDNPLSPRKYIIWRAYMNTHISPIYTVSFTVPFPSLVGRFATKPQSPSMKFPLLALMNVMSSFVPPSKMILVRKFFYEFREKKICTLELKRKLRSLVGGRQSLHFSDKFVHGSGILLKTSVEKRMDMVFYSF